MKYGLTTALACGAILALGACESNNPETATNGEPPVDPVPVDRVERTEVPMVEAQIHKDDMKLDLSGTTGELPMRHRTIRESQVVQGEKDGRWRGTLSSSISVTDGELQMEISGDAIYYDMQPGELYGANMDSWVNGPDEIRGAENARAGDEMTVELYDDLVAGGNLEGDAYDADAPRTLTESEAKALRDYTNDNCWTVRTAGPTCGNHHNITVTFGAPSESLDGNEASYWTGRVPLPKGVDVSAIERLADRDDKDLGRYELWLSQYAGKHAGADMMDETGMEGEGEAAEDGNGMEPRYLMYAAYGLFEYLDNLIPGDEGGYSRSQAFHIGHDAFADEEGMRTSDLAEAITGTFKGRTMAHVVKPRSHPDHQRWNVAGDRYISLRGDIMLNAEIGGANTVSGMIDGIESYDEEAWTAYDLSVTLDEGMIGADGSYTGSTSANGGEATFPDTGDYDGRFYGPAGEGIETAGWWSLGSAANDFRTDDGRWIIGSFGAVCTDCE